MLLRFCFCEDLNFGFLVGACLTRSENVFDVDCVLLAGLRSLRIGSENGVLKVFPALNSLCFDTVNFLAIVHLI